MFPFSFTLNEKCQLSGVCFTLLSIFALALCSGCALPYTERTVSGDLTSYEYTSYPELLFSYPAYTKIKFPDLRLKTGETYHLNKGGRATPFPCLLWFPLDRDTLLKYAPAKYHSRLDGDTKVVRLKKSFPHNEIKLRVKAFEDIRTIDDTVLDFSETRWIFLSAPGCDTAYAIKELPFCGNEYDALAIKVIKGIEKEQNQKALLMEFPFRVRHTIFRQKGQKTKESVLRYEAICRDKHHWRLGGS